METDPRKLKGGQKRKWMKENAPLVLDYLAKHGKGNAMICFGVTRPDGFDWLIDDESEKQLPVNSYEVRMAVTTARAAIESAKKAHVEIRGLEESYEHFIESLADQLNKKFLLPLLKLAFTLDATPFEPRSSPALLDDILNVPELEMPKAIEQPKATEQTKREAAREARRVAVEQKEAEKAQEAERLARELAERYNKNQPRGDGSVKVAYLSTHPFATSRQNSIRED